MFLMMFFLLMMFFFMMVFMVFNRAQMRTVGVPSILHGVMWIQPALFVTVPTMVSVIFAPMFIMALDVTRHAQNRF